MTPAPARPPRRSPDRRRQLVDAAVRVYTRTGVSATSVDEIVREAGVAKGTFYLYFPTRDAMVEAVAGRVVEGVAREIDRSLLTLDQPAAARIAGIAGAMSTVAADTVDRELVDVIHRPENREVHDRLTGAITARLGGSVRDAIADGIAAGEFVDQDPERSAAFVLAVVAALHDLVVSPDDLGPAVADLNAFVLRGLGHREAAR